MKILILGLILFFGGEKTNTSQDYSWVLEEMKNKVDMFEDLALAESKIRIYDVEGNQKGLYSETNMVENTLPLSDLRLIQESEFLFEFQGDSYYLLD